METKTLDLATMFDQAPALESAFKQESASILAAANAKCFFCGLSRHPRAKCPAREGVCRKCQINGHYAKVCRSSNVSASVTSTDRVTLQQLQRLLPVSITELS